MDDREPIAHRRKADGEHQSVRTHLHEVSEIAGLLAGKVGLQVEGELIGLLHDLGKHSNEFQNYIKSSFGLINQDEDAYVNARSLKGKVDHSTAGAQYVWRELSKKGNMGQIAGQIMALCVASHHAGLIDCLTTSGEDSFAKRINKQECKTHLDEVINKLDGTFKKRVDGLLGSPLLIGCLEEKLKILASGENSEVIVRFKVGLLVRFLFSCLLDADRINTSDFENPNQKKCRPNSKYVGWQSLVDRLEEKLKIYSADCAGDVAKIRRMVSDHCRDRASNKKGIYSLTVPTGGGKTLASLRFALHHAEKWGMDRIIYVVPFTTIIDQNADELRKILEVSKAYQGRIVLEHHSNLTPEEQGWKEKMLTENWDSPIIFTTMVQFLETLFGSGTRGARRMHQLANAVLIFDEIQTIPVNCVHLFNNATNFLVEHCGATAIMCTATQPLLNKVDEKKGTLQLDATNEIMPNVKKLFDDLKRVEIHNCNKPGGWTNKEIMDMATREVNKSGSCLIVVNTKKSAQDLYQIAKARTKARLYCLSTYLCPAHRKIILEDIKKQLGKQPVLCVSTQLIEAGVDIDFGSVIRFMAGLESIAQAAGRCNRHKKRDIGHVFVLNPSDESLAMLKDIREGKEQAERVLGEVARGELMVKGNLLDPEAMTRFYEYYFYSRCSEMDYPLHTKDIGHDDTLLNLLSVNSQAGVAYTRANHQAPGIYLRQSFMTAAKAFRAIDAPTTGIIVPYGKEGADIISRLQALDNVNEQFKLMRRAQQYTVNIYPYMLKKLRDDMRVVSNIQEDMRILYLNDSRYYHDEYGLCLTPNGEPEVYCV